MSESVLASSLWTARCMHDRSVTIPSELSLGGIDNRHLESAKYARNTVWGNVWGSGWKSRRKRRSPVFAELPCRPAGRARDSHFLAFCLAVFLAREDFPRECAWRAQRSKSSHHHKNGEVSVLADKLWGFSCFSCFPRGFSQGLWKTRQCHSKISVDV